MAEKSRTRQKQILVLLVIGISFLIHIGFIPFLPSVPLYNLDGWLTIEQVSLHNSGKDISYIPSLNPPDGKYLDEKNTLISWKPFNAWFTTIFTKETDPIKIFWSAGILHPLIYSIFIIILFFVCRDLFGEDVAAGVAILSALTPTALFNDIIFGSFDHHLFEVIFGTLFLLSVIGTMTSEKNRILYFILSIIFAIIGWENTQMFIVFIAVSIPMMLYAVFIKTHKIGILVILAALTGFVLKSVLEFIVSMTTNYTPNIELLWSWQMLILSPFIIIITILLLRKKITNVEYILVFIAFVPMFVMACRFVRIEMLIAPLLALFITISAYEIFNKQYWTIVSIIALVFIVIGIGNVAVIVVTANSNSDMSHGLQYLAHQREGVAMSWMGDSGYWIMTVANKSPMENPAGNEPARNTIARIFREENQTNLSILIKENNISYVIVSKEICAEEIGNAYYQWCSGKNYTGSLLWEGTKNKIYSV